MDSEKEFIKTLRKYTDYNSDYWNPSKFNWNHSSELCIHCSKYFKTWWNPKKFDWIEQSNALAKYCLDYFDKWWDTEKFNWKEELLYLINCCFQHIDKWLLTIPKDHPNIMILKYITSKQLVKYQSNLLLMENDDE